MFLAKGDPQMGVLAAELAANADFKFQLDAIQTLETGSKGPTGSLLKVFSFYGLGGGPWGGANGYTPVCPGFLGLSLLMCLVLEKLLIRHHCAPDHGAECFGAQHDL